MLAGGTKRARHRHSKLIKVARDASRHKPAKPCPYFDRVLLEFLNAGGNGLQRGAGSSKVSGLSKEDPILLDDGASTENPILLNDDFWQDDRKDNSSNEAGASGNIECGCCCSDFRFEEMVQVRSPLLLYAYIVNIHTCCLRVIACSNCGIWGELRAIAMLVKYWNICCPTVHELK